MDAHALLIPTTTSKPCRYCLQSIPEEASVCRHCQKHQSVFIEAAYVVAQLATVLAALVSLGVLIVTLLQLKEVSATLAIANHAEQKATNSEKAAAGAVSRVQQLEQSAKTANEVILRVAKDAKAFENEIQQIGADQADRSLTKTQRATIKQFLSGTTIPKVLITPTGDSDEVYRYAQQLAHAFESPKTQVNVEPTVYNKAYPSLTLLVPDIARPPHSATLIRNALTYAGLAVAFDDKGFAALPGHGTPVLVVAPKHSRIRVQDR